MKAFLFPLLLLLFISQAFSADTGYIKLKTSTIDESQLLQDLRRVGADYTLEKGIFQQEPKLPNGYWEIVETESASRKIHNGVHYYKFTVQIQSLNDPYLIRANYIIAFKPSNGDTRVISPSYIIISKKHEEIIVADTPSYVDLRELKKGSELQKYFDEGFKYTVEDAIRKGVIKKSTYSLVRVFSIDMVDFPSPACGFTLQIVSQQGQNYRLHINVWDNSWTEEDSSPDYIIYPNA